MTRPIERTFVLIKPDGVQRGLIGDIITRIEQRGLKVIALEMIHATKDQIDSHYPKADAWLERIGEKTLNSYEKYGYDAQEELGTTNKKEIGLMVRGWLIDYMTSAPMVKIIVEGVHAIDMLRKLAGHTLPAFAEMGTIRGDFSVDSAASANREKRAIMNIVHASETPEESENEIKLWFSLDQICKYSRN